MDQNNWSKLYKKNDLINAITAIGDELNSINALNRIVYQYEYRIDLLI